ncbi:MAG: 3-oxoacyl-[acyl-carrier protein] reductase [uncultured Corynebacteriales bacterium]|uniref:3-oxoacyl-[acyl-carrier protein] reductase n=1 Tax=uncultured Mycobacteriales bacterium TaxID=581187 RepID=A0A6J4JAW4_9ACTN|nr:MAG: 3-oxoacyl-[acyl-carrier protein] reductase [uncultured Corynebacteriales bacterium]
MGALTGKVAIVTGASRGVGRGIALGLGEAGATVYVTGRTVAEGTAPSRLPGTVRATAAEVTARGGTAVAAPGDAGDDAQLAALVDRVRAEQGRLDVLVNSAWGGYERFTDGTPFNPGPFWEQPLQLWDAMHRIGLRAHYVTTALAAPLLIASGGLVVSLSSFAGQVRVPPVPYGVAHAAIDRLARDMAADFRPHGVTSVSLYPGLVLTEGVLANIEHFAHEPNRETPLFVGRVVAALAADADRLRLTGRWLVAAELAADYGVTDEHGVRPHSNRRAILGEE